MSQPIWSFDTARFTVRLSCDYDTDPDLSWRDEDQVAYDEQHGVEYYVFKVEVLCDGLVIGADHLGDSGYSDPAEFRDHIGLAIKSRSDGANYGSYFLDMVKEAISEARNYLAGAPRVRIHA